MTGLRTLRLVCPQFWADVRLRQVAGRWLASADTPDGPSLGLGRNPIEALADALEPFDGHVDELLATVPDLVRA
jgi:hypothetical protein